MTREPFPRITTPIPQRYVVTNSILERARLLAEAKSTPYTVYAMRRITSIISGDDDAAEKFVRIARVIRDVGDEAAADSVLRWIEGWMDSAEKEEVR